MLRICLTFVLGIWAGIEYSIPMWVVWTFGGVLFSALIVLSLYRKQFVQSTYKGILWMLMLVTLGLGYSHMRGINNTPKALTNQSDDYDQLVCKVIGDGQRKTTLQVLQLVYSNTVIEHTGKISAYFDSAATTLPNGSIISLSKKPEAIPGPSNPYEFDYASFMQYKGITHQVFLSQDDYKVINNQADQSILAQLHNLRQYLDKSITTYIDGANEQAIAKAVLLGNRDELQTDLTEAYANSGALHVLAVSGLHVGILFLILRFLLKPLQARFKWGVMLISIGVIWLYAAITGFVPSVSRAAVMFTFIQIGITWNRQANIFNIILASALCLLIVNPFWLASVGFQLSYLAVLGIVYWYKPIYSTISPPSNWMLNKLWQITAVSLAAQLATIPISILYFNQFSLVATITNPVVLILTPAFFSTGLAMLVLSFIPAVASIIGELSSIIINVQNQIVQFINSLPYAAADNLHFTSMQVLLLYLVIIGFSLFLIEKKKSMLKYSLGLLLLLLSISSLQQIRSYHTNQMIVHQVKGSSISIKAANTIYDIGGLKNSNEAEYGFKVEPYRIASGGQLKELANDVWENKVYDDGSLYQQGDFIQVGEFRVLVLNEKLAEAKPYNKLTVNTIIVSGGIFNNLAQIQKHFEFDQVVLDNRLSPELTAVFENNCLKAGIKCFNVNKQGAFVMDLKDVS